MKETSQCASVSNVTRSGDSPVPKRSGEANIRSAAGVTVQKHGMQGRSYLTLVSSVFHHLSSATIDAVITHASINLFIKPNLTYMR